MRSRISLSLSVVSALAATLLFSAGTSIAATPQGQVSTDLSLRSDGATALAPVGGFGFLQNAGGNGSGGDKTLDGPYFLRSADPLPPGEIELKLVYRYVNKDNGGDQEDHEGTFVLEWGLMKDIEFILEVGARFGDGDVEGNGDIEEFGFHIKHWEEDGSCPAFATRHLIRIPTGDDSDGVDYMARGLFTWTLSDVVRLHFNPYLQTINGNRNEGTRHRSRGFGGSSSSIRVPDDDDGDRWFRWGAAIGFECRPRDNLVYILDYMVKSNDAFGQSDQHSIEIGGEWEFSPGHSFGWATEIEIDGDDEGDDFSISVSYIIELEGPTIGG